MAAHLTIEERRQRIRAIWRGDTFEEIAERFGLSVSGISTQLYNLGFKRGYSGEGVVAGPCIECFKTFPVTDINSDLQCDKCHRGIVEGPSLSLVQERQRSKERELERLAGLRSQLGQPRTPIRKILKGSRLQ